MGARLPLLVAAYRHSKGGQGEDYQAYTAFHPHGENDKLLILLKTKAESLIRRLQLLFLGLAVSNSQLTTHNY